MVRRIIGFAIALVMLGGLATTASANHQPGHGGSVDQGQVGSAAGLVAALVQANVALQDVNVDVVTIDIDDSLNNLLRDARILNNLLRNADVDVELIQVGDVNIEDVITIGDVTVTLEDVLQNFLNENNVLNDNVVAIGILSGGVVVFQN